MQVKCEPMVAHWDLKINRLSSSEIINKVCERLNVRVDKVLSKSRKQELVNARHLIFHILYSDAHLNLTKTTIGQIFKRDHSSVVHGTQVVEDRIHVDSIYRDMVIDMYLHIYGSLKYLYLNYDFVEKRMMIKAMADKV